MFLIKLTNLFQLFKLHIEVNIEIQNQTDIDKDKVSFSLKKKG